MISFASSIWLWAIAGIIIPLLIHLWNVKKGKTLKVGSILFFTETAVSRARSLQLTQLMLLLLRCLLFIFLAMFIAKPLLRSGSTSGNKGWLVMEKSTIPAAYREYGKEIDSMIAQGAELHELGGNFEAMSLKDSADVENRETSYWELLKQLQNSVPAGQSIKLYAENRLSRYEGERSISSLNMDVRPVHVDHETAWIEKAYASYDDSIVVLIGKSDPEGTRFDRIILSSSDQMVRQDPLSVKFENDSLQLDTNTSRVLIYADPGTKDGQYLANAIEAAKLYTKRKLTVVTDTSQTENIDWLFWLSARKIPANVAAKNIFAYAGGKIHTVATSFSLDNENSLVPAYQIYTDSTSVAGVVKWQTGLGQPMLSWHPTLNRFVFYSRFDPKWNGLVWRKEFPRFVVDLLFPSKEIKGIDNRVIADQQLFPIMKTQNNSVGAAITKPIDHWFWLIAFILFVVERIVSYRKQKLANG